MSKVNINNAHILQTGLSLGVDVMRSNLPKELKLVERAVIESCNDIGLNPEHEINGLSFIGRVILKIMELQTGCSFIPEHAIDSSRVIFISKVAAYAEKFRADKAAKAYSITVDQVTEMMNEASMFVSQFDDFGIDKEKSH
ncbi:TPA: hypothetical protein JRT94_001829 [Escherichia coli]|nr:hypothetical protein [Escherichia coli]